MSRSNYFESNSDRQLLQKIYSEADSALNTAIYGRITANNTTRYVDRNINYCASIAHNHLIPKMEMVHNDDVFTIGSYESTYFIGKEVPRIIPITKCTKFINSNNNIIGLHKPQKDKLNELIYDDNKSIFQSFRELRDFSLIYSQKLQQKHIQKQIEITRYELRYENRLNEPEIVAAKPRDDLIPTQCLYIPDILLGVNVLSATFRDHGQVKIISNVAEYDILSNTKNGYTNLLKLYFNFYLM